jgi:plasmid stabilization system protein ParE
MIVVYRPEAVSDLRLIARWYRKYRPEGEAKFFERFRATIKRIEQFPEAAPRSIIDEVIVYKARILRTAYSIAFTGKGGTIHILAISIRCVKSSSLGACWDSCCSRLRRGRTR